MGEVKIFLCYRRDDSISDTSRLYQDLVKEYGPGSVFMDVDSLPLGESFPEYIRKEISSCSAFLVVIGKSWLTISKNGLRRLDNPRDHVRREISYAVEQGKVIIPVLVQGATLPDQVDLPDELKSLPERQALQLTYAYWPLDIKRLKKNIRNSKKYIWPSVAGFLLVVLLGTFIYFYKSKNQESTGSLSSTADSTLSNDSMGIKQFSDSVAKVPVENILPDSSKKVTVPVSKKKKPAIDSLEKPGVEDVPLTGSTVSRSTTLVSVSRLKVRYEFKGEAIIFNIQCGTAFPSIVVDVNQNSVLDSNLDRSYGVNRTGDSYYICSQYLLRVGRTTFCGVAKSTASVNFVDSIYKFVIPLNELKSAPENNSISVQFDLYSLEEKKVFRFPTGRGQYDLTEVFRIGVSPRKLRQFGATK